MDKEALYANFMTSARKGQRFGMKAYWNQTVAQALAYALGIEQVPPSDQEFARLTEYYGQVMMVASQQEFDAFMIHATKALVEQGPSTQATGVPSLEDIGLTDELKKALSRRGVHNLVDLFTKDFSLTERQTGLLREIIGKNFNHGDVSDASNFEVDLTEPEAVT